MSKHEYHFGWHSIFELLEVEPESILAIFVQKGRSDQRLLQLRTQIAPFGLTIQECGKERLQKMCHSEYHQGIVAQTRAAHTLNEKDLESFLASKKQPLLLVLDQVTDPHNVGACIRTALSMGVDAIVCPRHHAAGLTPTVKKVSAGAANHLPFFQIGSVAKFLAELKTYGIAVVGTMLDSSAQPLISAELSGALAIVMGSEDVGIRPVVAEQCDKMIYIPMLGAVQSLNVSVASAMVLYEVMRQRQAAL